VFLSDLDGIQEAYNLAIREIKEFLSDRILTDFPVFLFNDEYLKALFLTI
jgi:hypothetical protein